MVPSPSVIIEPDYCLDSLDYEIDLGKVKKKTYGCLARVLVLKVIYLESGKVDWHVGVVKVVSSKCFEELGVSSFTTFLAILMCNPRDAMVMLLASPESGSSVQSDEN